MIAGRATEAPSIESKLQGEYRVTMAEVSKPHSGKKLNVVVKVDEYCGHSLSFEVVDYIDMYGGTITSEFSQLTAASQCYEEILI